MRRSRRSIVATTATATAMATTMAATLLAMLASTTVIVPVTAEDSNTIEYWTDLAVEPKRCISYNGADVVMYSMYADGANHCTDSPLGTYITPVAEFVDAYVAQLADNEADSYAGDDDAWAYEQPAAAAYLECTYRQIDGEDSYVRLGCASDDPLGLALNVYEDDACSQRVYDGDKGYEDPDVENDVNLYFKKCHPCVPWSDKNDDEIDDMYYENKQKNAPLCSTVWDAREACDSRCQLISMEKKTGDGWNRADKVLLSILSLFGAGMLVAIVQKRHSMSNKDALLEQAAMSAAGLQQTHVVGMFALVIVVVTVFALLGLKKITWALLLATNILLFAYLMKLTVDGSVKETIVGPDGQIMETNDDSDDDDDEGCLTPTSTSAGAPHTPMSGTTTIMSTTTSAATAGMTGVAGVGGYQNPDLPPVA